MLDLSVLNKPQKQVVRFGDGPLMVIAGAGSGKTRCLTYRVADLIKNRGVLPSRMIVTTFTTKATEEMTGRLEEIVGHEKVDRMRIGTFHSVFYKVLKDLLQLHDDDYEPPSLLMGGGQFFVILNHLRANKDSGDIKDILRQISLWKNDCKRVEDLEKELPKDDSYLGYYRYYEKYLKDNNKIDFDDMLFKTYWLLKDPGSAKYLEKLRKKTEYILVDEGQDLNMVQFNLVKMIAEPRRNVTMVLDDFQVLYGFRGAKISNIFQYMDEFKPTVIKLEQNYRSSETIVEIGNRLIKHNKRQIEKTLFTKNEIGNKPEVLVSMDADEEAEKVLEAIQYMVAEDGYSLNDIAVLYRTNSQSRAMVDILIRNDVPHIVHSNFGFYDRREVKDIVSYLRIVNQPWDAEIEDFKRILNKPSRFLGHKFLDSVEKFQIGNDYESFWEALKNFDGEGLNGSQAAQLSRFVDLIQTIHNWQKEKSVSTGVVIKRILDDTGYGEWLKKEMEDDLLGEPDDDKELNLDALMAGAERFKRVEHFLRYVDSIDQNGYEDEDDVVHLMTVHKAKGTEYPVVFVIGCSEGLLPHYRCDEIEEERRVAYVAVTRAMEQLFISLIHGKYNRRRVGASRFIHEMGLEIPQIFGGERIGYLQPVSDKSIGKDGQLELFPAVAKPLSVISDQFGASASYNLHGGIEEVTLPNFGTVPAHDDEA